MEFLYQVYLGNTVAVWLQALGVLVGVLIALSLVRRLILRYLERLVSGSHNVLDDGWLEAVRRTHVVFMIACGTYAASFVLESTEGSRIWINRGFVAVLLVQAGIWLSHALSTSVDLYKTRRYPEDTGAQTTMSLVNYLIKLVIWSAVLVLVLENLGVDVSGLVTGLGIGGIAIALAVQNILGDLFASLSIVLDRPFVVGDYLTVGNERGTVESIGLKTTRLRSLTGEQLIFSNNDLLQSRVQNFGRMQERRAAFTIGVTYETPDEKVRHIPEMIREAIEAQEQVRFDRSHFNRFADSALEIDTVYWVTVPDYAVYMDVQQEINLDLMRRFGEEGIEFAYPTRQIHVQGTLAGVESKGG